MRAHFIYFTTALIILQVEFILLFYRLYSSDTNDFGLQRFRTSCRNHARDRGCYYPTLKTELMRQVDELHQHLATLDTFVSINTVLFQNIEWTLHSLVQSKINFVQECPAGPANRSNTRFLTVIFDDTLRKPAESSQRAQFLNDAVKNNLPILLVSGDEFIAKEIRNHKNIRVLLKKHLSRLPAVLQQTTREIQTRYVVVFASFKRAKKSFLSRLATAIDLLQKSKSIRIVTFPLQKNHTRFLNCYGMELSNYHLDIVQKGRWFENNNLLCRFSYGPFLTTTQYLQQFSFDEHLATSPTSILFLDYFLHVYIRNDLIANCLDCTPVTSNSNELTMSKYFWIPFMRKYNLNSINVDDKQTLEFLCEEVNVVCSWKSIRGGLAFPKCCLKKQQELVLTVVKLCDKLKIPYVLDSGTALAAAKLQSVMPWDQDADMLFLNSSFAAIKISLLPLLRKKGLSIEMSKTAVGMTIKYTDKRYEGLSVDFYSSGFGDEKVDFKQKPYRKLKTKFYNYITNVPHHLGLYIRHKYGLECYKHTLHWFTVGEKRDRYHGGRFMPCKMPKHHACLDVLMPDGNMEFIKNWNEPHQYY